MDTISTVSLPEYPSLWHYLALSDEQLEQADLVAMNLSIACGIASLKDLNIQSYCRVVDAWTRQFARILPATEARFRRTPEKWKNDIRFYRVGMLQGFLSHEIGLRYKEEQKYDTVIHYTNPADLFINGVIDIKQGTCGNMPLLHVAISRRLGWPVSLACAKSHLLSRFDDGQVVHNIETTDTDTGSFCSEEDDFYIKRFNLPGRAVDCGSDLRKLSAREMMGLFISKRGRHYRDSGCIDLADLDYSLCRVLFPQYRENYIAAMMPMLKRGEQLFDSNEVGHPNSLFGNLAGAFAAHERQDVVRGKDQFVNAVPGGN